MFINRALKQCLIVTPLALAMGCGGSSKSVPTAAATASAGNFSLAITDGPVDSATKVVVEFTGVTLKPADGEIIEFAFDAPVSIDLLTLQGQVSQYILAAESIPAGDYEWVRLSVTAELDGVLDSYLELNDGTQLELFIPSGAESGLKLVSGFTVPEEGDADFTVDFDLRKSIVVKGNGDATSAMLKPTLRIVDTISAGSIEGEIDAETVAAQCAAPDVNSGAVYVFAPGKGHSDVRGSDADPIASALVKFDDGAYRYELGFVPEGDYQVAFTCDAALDDPEAEDQLTFVDVSPEHVKVTVGENVIVDFIPGETLPHGGPVPGADKSDEGGKPEAPGKPEVPGAPGQGVPEMPEGETPVTEAPGKPVAPGKPEVPGAPGQETPEMPEGETPVTEAPGKPAAPGKPEVPGAPGEEAPQMPEGETPVTEAPGNPAAPGKPELPGKPEAPETELPEVEVPDVQVPEVDAPEAETPAPGKPAAPGKPETPKAEAPEVDVPEVEVPEVETPEVDVPEVETPKPGKPAVPGKPALPQVPEVEAPETEIPEMEVPEVEVPETEAPEIEVPEVNVPGTDLPEVAAPGKGRQDKAPVDKGSDDSGDAEEGDAEEESETEELNSEESPEQPQA